jgi:hypothetical protein
MQRTLGQGEENAILFHEAWSGFQSGDAQEGAVLTRYPEALGIHVISHPSTLPERDPVSEVWMTTRRGNGYGNAKAR